MSNNGAGKMVDDAPGQGEGKALVLTRQVPAGGDCWRVGLEVDAEGRVRRVESLERLAFDAGFLGPAVRSIVNGLLAQMPPEATGEERRRAIWRCAGSLTGTSAELIDRLGSEIGLVESDPGPIRDAYRCRAERVAREAEGG